MDRIVRGGSTYFEVGHIVVGHRRWLYSSPNMTWIWVDMPNRSGTML